MDLFLRSDFVYYIVYCFLTKHLAYAIQLFRDSEKQTETRISKADFEMMILNNLHKNL